MPLERGPPFPRDRVPELDGLIVAGRRQVVPSGGEGHVMNQAGRAFEGEWRAADAGGPELDRLVVAARRQQFAVRRMDREPDLPLVALERGQYVDGRAGLG